MNRAPHPNAAKVLINWLLSKEGQSAVQKHLAAEGNVRESLTVSDRGRFETIEIEMEES